MIIYLGGGSQPPQHWMIIYLGGGRGVDAVAPPSLEATCARSGLAPASRSE